MGEAVEDALFAALRDAGPAVEHLDHRAAAPHPGDDLDRIVTGRIPGRVVDGVQERMVETHRVRAPQGQGGIDRGP